MGAGKTTVGERVARRLGRPFVDLDREVERRSGERVPALWEQRGEAVFRVLEAKTTLEALGRRDPSVLALGGGAILSAPVRAGLREHATTVLLDVDVEEAWRRVRGTERPLAAHEPTFRALYRERHDLYRETADATAQDDDDVVLAAGLVHVAEGGAEAVGELTPGRGVALVADELVAELHGDALRSALGSRLRSEHVVPSGEEAKTLAACQRLWSELALERGDTLVALGGGCTTDVAGFVASTHLRGIPWVAVPTTLVGQVDAAIGGKTGINLPAGKNLVGSFHWPARTVIDPVLLRTLPERERAAGMAEVVKTGLLAGEALWELPEPELVRRSAAFKTAVCLRDPGERGDRAILNLGHTFAHALEAGSGHRVSHGEAVALGLLAALRLSGLREDARTVAELLRPVPVAADRERAWAALRRDKKAVDGRIRLVLLDAPGRPRITSDVAEDDVRRALDDLIAD